MRNTKRVTALLLAFVLSLLLVVPAFAVTATKRHSGIYIGDVTFYIYDSAYSTPYYSYTRPGSVDVSIFEINGEITFCLEPFQPSEVDARYQESGFPSYMAGREGALLRALCYGAPANGDASDEARVATQLLIWDITMGYADGQWNWISPNQAKPPFYAAAESLLPTVKEKYDTVVAALKANSGLPAGVSISDMHFWDDDGTYDPRLQTMVSINLPQYGKLNLKKVSADAAISEGNSNYSLAGAVYGLYTSQSDASADQNRKGTLTTEANGVSNTIENLAPGTYWVREITAPKGFALNTTPVSVVVRVNELAQVTMTDNPQTNPVGILLKKVDSATNGAPASGGLSLEGAEFTVKFYGGNYSTASAAESSGTLKRQWVFKTNANGYCELAQRYKVSGDDFYLTPGGVPTLPLGTVVIQETKAPSGYQINSQKYVVRITTGGVSTETVNTYNAPTVSEDVTPGKVQLTKTSEDGNVSGIEFTVTGPNGYSKTVKTDSNGKFTLKDLYPGTYTVTENTPSDYQVQEPQTVTIGPGETGTVTFANKLKRGKVQLTKTSEDGNVSGIEFTVTGPNGFNKTVKTDANGKFTLKDLYPGTYTVTENTPVDYQAQEPQTVTIAPGETGTVTFANKLKRGKVQLTKTSEDGNVSGIEFTVTGPNGFNKTVKTDANGKFTLKDLYPGTYTVTENTPSDYQTQDPQTVTIGPGETGTVTFANKLKRSKVQLTKTSEDGNVAGIEFTVTGPNGFSKTMKTDSNGKFTLKDLYPGTYTVTEKTPDDYQTQEPQTVTIGPGETGTVTFSNKLKRGKVQLTKTSEDGNVSGIEFTVTGPNGYSKTVKTDSSGKFTLKDLYPGTYTVTENTPSDYQAQEPQTVTIGPGETGTVTFANKLKRGKVQLTKTSEDGNVSGIEFTVTGPNGYSKTVKTDSNGKFTLKDLYPGTYTVTENTPWGYDPPEPQTVTILPGETGTVSFYNKLSRANIQVIKLDGETKQPLAGAGFHLFDASGNLIAEAFSNKKGEVNFKNLVLGNYTYQEFKAPKGFVLDETIYPVTLDTSGATVQHTRENNPRLGSISIHKINESGVVMPGTEVMLQASEDNGETWTDVSKKTTDANGDAVWTDLPVRGIRYRVIEVNANAGSSLMTKPIWEGTLPVKISKDNVAPGVDAEIIDDDAYIYDLQITAINTPIMVLPFTGSGSMAVYVSLSMLTLCVGIYLFKKHKEEFYE